MAVSSFLALLDDVAAATKVTAASLDDVASLTVQSSQKATGIVVDDMGVTAGGMVGMDAKRELPVVKAVALGSLKNKFFYLIPGALGLSVAAPGAIAPLLMAGGAFLCYEGWARCWAMAMARMSRIYCLLHLIRSWRKKKRLRRRSRPTLCSLVRLSP